MQDLTPFSDQSQQVVWSADAAPFGETTATGQVTFNLRFPGQYYDQETGLHYNYYRYYDPSTGRYMTSDPIGLDGGLNTYGYANANPINVYDPNGLLGIQDGGIDAALEFITQLAENDGNLACVDFRAVAIAGVSGTVSLNYLARLKRIQRLAGLLKNKFSKVSKYEVGSFDDLTKRSSVGDKLDIHHAPQKHPAGQVIDGYDPKTAPSIAIPAGEHRRVPTIKGEYSGNPRDLLAKDIKDLRQHTNAPNSALQDLIRLNKETNTGAFNK